MSIYASLTGISQDDPSGSPWLYQGPHIVPAKDGPRGGEIGLAAIPSHITRDGRDDRPWDGAPWPWLRLSLDGLEGDDLTAVIITPAQARALAQQLVAWADTAEPTAPTA